jgi:acyl dehydratase
MIDRSLIGFTTAPTMAQIDPWRVHLFCQAIGETDPIYWDANVATTLGHRACPVPPTFLKAMEGEHFSSAQLLKHLNVAVRGVLHAEQTFEYLAPLCIGDTVEISRKVMDIYDKKQGALTFIVVDSHYRVSAQPVANSRQTILVRNSLKTL